MINCRQLIVTQKQYVGSGNLLLRKNIQAQVTDRLDSFWEPKYTGATEKTNKLFNCQQFIVKQKQYTCSGNVLARTKIYKHNCNYCNNLLLYRNNTHATDKTIKLINRQQFIVTQKQYISSGNLLSRTKMYMRKWQTVWIVFKNKNIHAQLTKQIN